MPKKTQKKPAFQQKMMDDLQQKKNVQHNRLERPWVSLEQFWSQKCRNQSNTMKVAFYAHLKSKDLMDKPHTWSDELKTFGIA